MAKVFRDSVEIIKTGNRLKVVVHNPKLPFVSYKDKTIGEKNKKWFPPTDLQSVIQNEAILSKEIGIENEKLVLTPRTNLKSITKSPEEDPPPTKADIPEKSISSNSVENKKNDKSKKLVIPESEIPLFSEKKDSSTRGKELYVANVI